MNAARMRLEPCSAPPENVVEGVGMFGRPGRFRPDEFKVESNPDPAGDLILQGEQIARVAIGAVSPQMRVGLGIDQLGGDSDLIARSPDAPFEHVAHTKL